MTTEKPEGSTHTRDGEFYRVTDKVQYLEYGEWNDCKDAYDLTGWLEELTAITGNDT